MDTEIQKQLEQLAIKRSIPFCYGCYKEAPTGCCDACGSDDLMRLLPGDGCEYSTDWIIKSILESELTAVDLAEKFEEHIRQCYPETTQVGWMSLDTVSVMKDQDPVSWSCALSEWESQEAEEGTIISFDGGSTYYRCDDVENLLRTEA
ncbi:MAG: hypothetical protein SGJ18_09595 [Pseudomonadota bacterium]|nr:hypothetical protein [Pseudomonadota bacterium]